MQIMTITIASVTFALTTVNLLLPTPIFFLFCFYYLPPALPWSQKACVALLAQGLSSELDAMCLLVKCTNDGMNSTAIAFARVA